MNFKICVLDGTIILFLSSFTLFIYFISNSLSSVDLGEEEMVDADIDREEVDTDRRV